MTDGLGGYAMGTVAGLRTRRYHGLLAVADRPYLDAARHGGATTTDLLDGLSAHVADWGVGSVSETADGAAPHSATGCPFQAWSVAELLRMRRAHDGP